MSTECAFLVCAKLVKTPLMRITATKKKMEKRSAASDLYEDNHLNNVTVPTPPVRHRIFLIRFARRPLQKCFTCSGKSFNIWAVLGPPKNPTFRIRGA